jgi:hypothetical protein
VLCTRPALCVWLTKACSSWVSGRMLSDCWGVCVCVLGGLMQLLGENVCVYVGCVAWLRADGWLLGCRLRCLPPV